MAKHPYLRFTDSTYGKTVGTQNGNDYGNGLTNKAIKIVQIPPIFDDDCVVEVGQRAFASTRITSVFIPKTVLRISWGAFEGTLLTEARFEAGSRLEKINGAAFYLCSQLKKIEFPSSVKTIDSSSQYKVFLNVSLECFSYQGSSNFSNIYMFTNVSEIHVSSSYPSDELGRFSVTNDGKTCDVSHERFYPTRRLCNSHIIRYQCHTNNFIFVSIFLSRQ